MTIMQYKPSSLDGLLFFSSCSQIKGFLQVMRKRCTGAMMLIKSMPVSVKVVKKAKAMQKFRKSSLLVWTNVINWNIAQRQLAVAIMST